MHRDLVADGFQKSKLPISGQSESLASFFCKVRSSGCPSARAPLNGSTGKSQVLRDMLLALEDDASDPLLTRAIGNEARDEILWLPRRTCPRSGAIGCILRFAHEVACRRGAHRPEPMAVPLARTGPRCGR